MLEIMFSIRSEWMILHGAKSLGYVVVTNNIREFERVKGLDLENWAE